jgi:hypothetical protein
MLVGFSLGTASQFEPVKNARPLWRVSCGYEREASSAWAATAIARLHRVFSRALHVHINFVGLKLERGMKNCFEHPVWSILEAEHDPF